MRIGILAGSFPAAARIQKELESIPGCEIFILLCKTPGESLLRHIAKQLVLLALRKDRRNTWRIIRSGKVFVLNKAVDEAESLATMRKLNLDLGLHNVGVIYRKPTIEAFKLGILNPHIGILPEYRGRSVMEWALLNGGPVGVSVFFIDAGIDTGERIVLSEQVDVSHCRSVEEAKNYLFSLDAVFFRRSIELLLHSHNFTHNLHARGCRYYVMSRLFHNVVNQLIRAHH